MKQKLVLSAGLFALLCLGFLAGRLTPAHPGSAPLPHRILYYVDPMHPAYRSPNPGIAPDCGMELEPVFADADSARTHSLEPGSVSLTPDRQRLIGLQTTAASRTAGVRTLRTTGRIVPLEDRLFRMQAGFDGWVDSLRDTPAGTRVHKDQVLATLYGPDIRSVALNYIGFISGVERVRQGMGQGDSKQLDDSRKINEEQLRLLGMGQKQIDELAATHRTVSSLDLVAPADAIVLARSVSAYQRFEKGAELFRLADLRKVLILADLHGPEVSLAAIRQVRIFVPQVNRWLPAQLTAGTPLFDDNTKSLKLRLEADNPDLLLQPDMFVDVELQIASPAGLSIPADAVVDRGRAKIVYIETSPGVYAPRPVSLAGTFDDQAIVVSGLTGDERVVTSGTFLLDSESRLRAGTESDSALSAASPPAPAASKKPITEDRTHDPVCGMVLSSANSALHQVWAGKSWSFCSESCRRKFAADPARYAAEKLPHLQSAGAAGSR